nr:reverse transcriptase domain-containing protein [Tanacetum cinerariifolium]
MDESWMKAPIVFPPLSMEDASNEPLIIEAIMEGYLVRRMDLVGFAGGVVKPLGKIKLEVVFDEEGPASKASYGKKDEGSKHRRKGGLEAGGKSDQRKLCGN